MNASIHRRRRRPGAVAAVFVLALVALSAGVASAQARAHQITWAHPSASTVSRFVVWVSPIRDSLDGARQIDVGMPAPETVGSMSVFSAMITFEENEFVAVAAVGLDGQMSEPSAFAGMPPTRPGQPNLVQP